MLTNQAIQANKPRCNPPSSSDVFDDVQMNKVVQEIHAWQQQRDKKARTLFKLNAEPLQIPRPNTYSRQRACCTTNTHATFDILEVVFTAAVTTVYSGHKAC